MHVDYLGLGMRDWADVIAVHAVPEPSRPAELRNLQQSRDREMYVARALGFGIAQGQVIFRDVTGRAIRLEAPSIIKKLAKYANHAAYASWIPMTLSRPLELWEHADLRNSRGDTRPRRYYMGAYTGPGGLVSHVAIAVVAGVLINTFRLDGIGTANDYRYGRLHYVSYRPVQG